MDLSSRRPDEGQKMCLTLVQLFLGLFRGWQWCPCTRGLELLNRDKQPTAHQSQLSICFAGVRLVVRLTAHEAVDL